MKEDKGDSERGIHSPVAGVVPLAEFDVSEIPRSWRTPPSEKPRFELFTSRQYFRAGLVEYVEIFLMFKLIDVAVSEYGENVLRRSLPESLPAVHVVRQISAHVRQMRVFALVEIPRFDIFLIFLFLLR